MIEAQEGKKKADKFGPDLLRHEAVHSEQWAQYGDARACIRDYTRASTSSWWNTDTPWAANKFEVEANLWWGGYLNCGPPTLGPVS
ncbi:hypothetical protein GCM10020367_17490 [Streptomyces sannanensis]|uniref:DUF4157 domain-containing protein n=1 Tax=Streptomyces sannanensis TaxID=285536 RepID=A0ABP6S829_9ACTN